MEKELIDTMPEATSNDYGKLEQNGIHFEVIQHTSPHSSYPTAANFNQGPAVGEGLPRADYIKEREALVAGERAAAESLDKAVLTLAGGVFALTITFMKDIAPQAVATGWVLAAWMGFAISLLATLVSFLFSQDAWRRQRKILDDLYLNKPAAEKQTNWQSRLTGWLNWTSILGFIFGVATLAVFAYCNL